MTAELDAGPDAGRPASGAPVRMRTDHPAVLLVGGTHGATWRYRVGHHVEQLRQRAVDVRAIMQWHPDLLDAGLGRGIVILHRVAWDPPIARLIQQTRATDGVVLFDIDDLVFEPESTHWHHGVTLLDDAERDLYHDGVRRYRRTLEACDGAIVPTTFLAGRVRRLGKPAWISRNCIDLELLRLGARAIAECGRSESEGSGDLGDGTSARTSDPAGTDVDAPIVIGYASGSRTHDRDFSAAAGPALRRIMLQDERVRLRVIGPLQLDARWEPLSERIQRVPAVPWRELPQHIAEFDISLAPLELENPFCESKSELKWLEASASGVPSVASDTAAFREAIAAADRVAGSETGLLARTEGDWSGQLHSLIQDPSRRRAMGRAARRVVARQRSTTGQAADYEATLGEIRRHLGGPRFPPPPPADDGPLSIGVLMPEPPRGSGGHTSIMRLMGGLDASGHRVTVHIDPSRDMVDATDREITRFMRAHFPRSGVRFRKGRDLRPADVGIATGWTTAHPIALDAPVRSRLYLVQDFEPFFQSYGPDWLAAEDTYRMGMGHITLGPWLADTLRERYGARADHFDFAVDHGIYHPGDAPPAGERAPRVVFYGRGTTPRRGVALGLEALREVHRRRPDVEIVLYGGRPAQPVDFPVRLAGVLTQSELADLFRSASVGLALSFTNLSLVLHEMAACGCPVVVADSEPARWYQRDGVTCAVAEPTPSDLARRIIDVLDAPDVRQRLARGGWDAVADLSWDRSVARFVEHVTQYAREDIQRARRGRAPATGPDPQVPATMQPADIEPGPGAREVAEIPLTGTVPTRWMIDVARDGLCRIDLRFAPADPAGTPRGLLVLRLRTHASDPTLLAQATVDATRVVSGDAWVPFTFEPLAYVAGRTLAAELHWLPDVPPGGPLPSRDGLHLIVQRQSQSVSTRGGGGRSPVDGGNAAGTPGGTEPSEVERATGAPVPDWRAFALEDPPRDAGRSTAAPGPELQERYVARRREAAAAQLALHELQGERWLNGAIRWWRRVAGPLPPVPMRPWPDDAPAIRKLTAGVAAYGPLRMARELLSWASWRRRPAEWDR